MTLLLMTDVQAVCAQLDSYHTRNTMNLTAFSTNKGILRKDGKFFYLEPIVGSKRINCLFPNELLKLANIHLQNYVEIHGIFEYHVNDKFPYEVAVTELKIMPNEKDLPTLYDLQGVAENYTNGLSSEDCVRKMRDDEW